MGKALGISKWEQAIKDQVCPYGHDIQDCHRLRWDGQKNRFKHYCAYRERTRKGRKGVGPIQKRFNPYPDGMTTNTSSPGKRMQHKDQFKVAHIEFVCGHTAMYTRRAIEVNAFSYPGDLWCERCVEWKKVHYASNCFVADPGWIFNPKEVAE